VDESGGDLHETHAALDTRSPARQPMKRRIAIICRIKETGRLLFITT
jgi:hypothetical protein